VPERVGSDELFVSLSEATVSDGRSGVYKVNLETPGKGTVIINGTVYYVAYTHPTDPNFLEERKAMITWGDNATFGYEGNDKETFPCIASMESINDANKNLLCTTYFRRTGDDRMIQGSWTNKTDVTNSILSCFQWAQEELLAKPECAQPGAEVITVVLIPEDRHTFDMPEIDFSTEFVHSQFCSAEGINTEQVCATYFRRTGDDRMIQGSWTNNGVATSSIQSCFQWAQDELLAKPECAQPGGEFITVVLIPQERHTFELSEINFSTEFVHSQFCNAEGINTEQVCATYYRESGEERMIQGSWTNDVVATSSIQSCFQWAQEKLLEKPECAQSGAEFMTVVLIPQERHTFILLDCCL